MFCVTVFCFSFLSENLRVTGTGFRVTSFVLLFSRKTSVSHEPVSVSRLLLQVVHTYIDTQDALNTLPKDRFDWAGLDETIEITNPDAQSTLERLPERSSHWVSGQRIHPATCPPAHLPAHLGLPPPSPLSRSGGRRAGHPADRFPDSPRDGRAAACRPTRSKASTSSPQRFRCPNGTQPRSGPHPRRAWGQLPHPILLPYPFQLMARLFSFPISHRCPQVDGSPVLLSFFPSLPPS